MIAADEDALLCDFAEIYHIYDMHKMPLEYIATLAMGLRDDSRIKLKLSGLKADTKTLLLAHIADNTAINVYFKTKDAQKGRNAPKSLLAMITKPKQEDKTIKFVTGDDFMNEWRRLNGN